MTGNNTPKSIYPIIILSILIFLFGFSTPLLAKSETDIEEVEMKLNDNATIYLGTAYLFGQANEIVYNRSPQWKVSHLIWDIDSLAVLGAGIKIRLIPSVRWFKAGLEFWGNAWDGEGTMDDYDWLAYPDLNWSDWSHHDDTKVTRGYQFDYFLEGTFLNTRNFTLAGLVGYKRNTFEWTAYGGSYIYSSSGTLRDQTGNFTDGEAGITYEQQTDIPYLGLVATAHMGPISIEAKGMASTIARTEATDHHHLRNLVTYADIDNQDMYGVEIGAKYHYNQFAGHLSYRYEEIKEGSGDSHYHWGDGTVTTYVDAEGASMDFSMIKATLSYHW